MCKQRFSLKVKVNILTFKFVPHSFRYVWTAMDFGNEINKFYPDHFPVPYIRLSQLRFKIKMMFPQFSFDCTNE